MPGRVGGFRISTNRRAKKKRKRRCIRFSQSIRRAEESFRPDFPLAFNLFFFSFYSFASRIISRQTPFPFPIFLVRMQWCSLARQEVWGDIPSIAEIVVGGGGGNPFPTLFPFFFLLLFSFQGRLHLPTFVLRRRMNDDLREGETFLSAKQSTVRVASASSKQRRADATLLAKLLNPCPQGKRTQVSGWDSLLLFLSSGPASNNLLLPPPHL